MRTIIYLMIIIFFFINCSGKVISFEKSEITIKTQNNKYVFEVEVAKTYEERNFGLMNRKNLEQNHGMVFIYQNHNL